MINDRTDYATEIDPSAGNNSHSFALDMIGGNKRVLELGCGGGYVTRALVRQGCTVVGCELDPAAAEQAREAAEAVHVIDLGDPTALQKAVGDDHFDVVLAGDVLEHLPDPLPVLRACRPLLEERRGVLVVSLPNVAHADVKLRLLAGGFRYTDEGLLDRTHLRFFTRDSVRALLRDAGFRMTEVRRTVKPVFETEQAVDPASVAPEVLEAALADPDALTYQFVVKAVLDDADAELAGLAERVVRLEDELVEAERRASTIPEGLVPAAELTDLRAALEQAEARVAQLADERDRAQGELEAIQHTLSYRITAPLRAVRRVLP